jgi:hypothetical protein
VVKGRLVKNRSYNKVGATEVLTTQDHLGLRIENDQFSSRKIHWEGHFGEYLDTFRGKDIAPYTAGMAAMWALVPSGSPLLHVGWRRAWRHSVSSIRQTTCDQRNFEPNKLPPRPRLRFVRFRLLENSSAKCRSGLPHSRAAFEAPPILPVK